MKSGIYKVALPAFLLVSNAAMAQTADKGASNYFVYAIVGIVALILLYLIIQVADNLLAIEAKQLGADKTGVNYSIFPRLREIFSSKAPSYAPNAITLSRGFNIKLEGEAAPHIDDQVKPTTFGVQPGNFHGTSPIPKVEVEVGAEVKAGDHLFFDKQNPDVKYVAPVSGEVIAINRGEKRSIREIIILADKEIKYRKLTAPDPDKATREELVAFLLDCGFWPMIHQRPFDLSPNPQDIPRDIFISTFDTAPLAPDLSFIVTGREAAFQRGLDILGKLTSGKVYLGLDARGANPPAAAFTEATGVEKYWFRGKHPAGNVGVQIHHVKPIGAGQKVWTLGVQEVITLGNLFIEHRLNTERVVALTGAELKETKYVRTYLGANIGELTKDNLSNTHVRYISGDVLTGSKKTEAEFLNFFDDQVTVIEEGDYFELFGWLIPSSPRPSISRTYPNFMFPNLKYRANSNTHGEKRAFVMTGQYEEVLPMDIYPQHLMKAILAGDFERMEGLGIYELTEEDIALCEFVCTSKQPLQAILRDGLDMMHEQS